MSAQRRCVVPCFHTLPCVRISSKENTSHLYKGRHMHFDGFRCFVAAAPAHVTSGPRVIPADAVAAPFPHTHSLLVTLAISSAQGPKPPSHRHLCSPTLIKLYRIHLRSNAFAVSPHDHHIGEILPQTCRFSFTPYFLAHRSLVLQSSATPADAACGRQFTTLKTP